MNLVINRSLAINRLINTSRFAAITRTSRSFASKSNNKSGLSDEELHKPIDYLQSPAAQWKAQWSAGGTKDTSPWIESWSVLASIAVFMIYFGILREENDIDDMLRQPLNEHVPGLEEQTLITSFLYSAKHGQDTKAVEARMRELGVDVEKLRRENL